MKTDKSLEDIIKGCVNKNKDDQKLFFEKYAGMLMAVCQRVGPNDHVANDILQDAFIKIFKNMKHIHSYDEATVYAWCKRVVTNQAIDFYRSEKKYSHDFNDFNNGDASKHWDNEVGLMDEGDSYLEVKNIPPAKIIKAIQNLSPKYKLVFNMFVMDGLTHDEIGEVLNISTGTSKSNLSKAKQKLRRELESV